MSRLKLSLLQNYSERLGGKCVLVTQMYINSQTYFTQGHCGSTCSDIRLKDTTLANQGPLLFWKVILGHIPQKYFSHVGLETLTFFFVKTWLECLCFSPELFHECPHIHQQSLLKAGRESFKDKKSLTSWPVSPGTHSVLSWKLGIGNVKAQSQHAFQFIRFYREWAFLVIF